MMKRVSTRVLDLSGFDWRMFSPGAGTCDGAPFKVVLASVPYSAPSRVFTQAPLARVMALH
jgi:hypothetical protein